MTTLSDVSKILSGQDEALDKISVNTEKTSEAITRFVDTMERNRFKDLESQREQKKTLKERLGALMPGKGSSSDGVMDKLHFGKGGLLGPAALLGFGTAAMSGLARRGAPAALGLIFADEIGDWVTSQTGKKELGEAAERATIGGSFGLLLGKKFGVIGAAIGLLATEENTEIMTDIGKNLKANWNSMAEKLEPYLGFLPSFENVVSFLATQTNKGLSAINGFLESGFSSEEFQENWGSAVGLLASVALILAPGKFMRSLRFLAMLAGSPVIPKSGGMRLRGRYGTPLKLFAALAAGTFAYDQLLDGGDGIGTDDLTAGVGTMAVAAGADILMSRRGMTSQEIAQQRAVNSRMPPPPKPTIVGKVNGKDVVKSSSGKLSYAGVDGKATTNMLSQTDINKIKPVGPKWYQRFPRVGKLLRGIPGSSLIFSAIDGYYAYQIMTDPTLPFEYKVAAMGQLLGGNIGAIGGGALGLAVGGPIGGLIGSFAGYFGGGWIGEKIANWMLQGKDDKELEKQILDDINMNAQARARFENPTLFKEAQTGGFGGLQLNASQLALREKNMADYEAATGNVHPLRKPEIITSLTPINTENFTETGTFSLPSSLVAIGNNSPSLQQTTPIVMGDMNAVSNDMWASSSP
jgi:hypothetical protein